MLIVHDSGHASLTVCSQTMDCTSFIGQRLSVGAQYFVIFGSARILMATATTSVETVGLPDRSYFSPQVVKQAGRSRKLGARPGDLLSLALFFVAQPSEPAPSVMQRRTRPVTCALAPYASLQLTSVRRYGVTWALEERSPYQEFPPPRGTAMILGFHADRDTRLKRCYAGSEAASQQPSVWKRILACGAKASQEGPQ